MSVIKILSENKQNELNFVDESDIPITWKMYDKNGTQNSDR